MIGVSAAAAICIVGVFVRWLTVSGAAAAFVVGSLVWLGGGWAAAVPLLTFFCSSSALGTIIRGSQKRHEPRTWRQVVCNGGAGAVFCALHLTFGIQGYLPAAVACFAAANADTWATEIGVRFGKRAFRAATLEHTTIGVSGAVSVPGLFAAYAGAAVVALSAAVFGEGSRAAMITTVGFFACMFDSVLGDLFQGHYRRADNEIRDEKTAGSRIAYGVPWLSNNAVNLITTSAAATAAYFFAAA